MQQYRFNFKKVLILCTAVLGFGQYAMAENHYYAQMIAEVSSNSTTGSGTVYVNNKPGPDGDKKEADNSGGSVNFDLRAEANEGFDFKYWSDVENGSNEVSTDNPWSTSMEAATSDGGTTTKTYYAVFVAKTLFYFSAEAVSTQENEDATEEYNESDYGEHWDSDRGSTVATFTATTNTGYAFAGWSETADGAIISTDNPYTIRLWSTCTTSVADAPTVTYYARYANRPLPPTITSNETSTGFSVTLGHLLDDVSIYYTIDGSEPSATHGTQYNNPFNASDLTTIKAIAVKNGVTSDVESVLLIKPTGSNGSRVVLNDYEDHTWTYYAGVSSDVDEGDYNTNYVGKMYSPDPRNVKITYQANRGQVSISETDTEFVYYKTIEKVDDTYKYQVISNPFSKRPSTGSGSSKVHKGFGGWKIISGGDYIQGKNNNDVLTLDEELTLTGLDNNYTANCTSAEIVLQATWVDATVVRNTTSGLSTTGTYETNIIVLSQNYTNNITPSYPCTIMMVEPDGSADYRNSCTFSGDITPADLHDNGKTTKIEFAHWTPGSNGVNPQGRNFTIGRGMTMDGTARTLYGSNSNVVMNQVLIVESGTFSGYRGCANMSSHTKQIVEFGNDYDRAQEDNDNLSITGAIYGLTASSDLGLTNVSKELFHITTKSGKFYPNPDLTNATYSNSFYLFDYSAKNNGTRTLVIEGGEFGHIAGGANSTSDDATVNAVVNLKVRMKGGTVNGSIYGGAAQYNCSGSKQFVFTGGTIKGWIAGGSNGYSSGNQGSVTGASYVYIGGNTQVNSNGDNTVRNAGVGGTVYGAGCGQSSTATSGRVALGTNVVVADNAYVERGVYGGGSFGYCPTDKTSNIYITGGEVGGNAGAINRNGNNYSYSSDITGGVYGGACQNSGGAVNIYMTGGLVKGGLYGGSNVSGTINQNDSIVVTGGQVGTLSQTANIHGGGYGSSTVTTGNVDVTIGADGAARDADGPVIYGDVYGGSALGKVNGTAANAGKHTNVTLNAGTINGSLYGGGLGDNSHEADVNGTVQVTVNGGSVRKTTVDGSGGVYGCNNINGAPQGNVLVDIYGTNSAPSDDEYAIYAVYGGGNQADYEDQPIVTIHNCDNSIEYVYGGGNAAAVATTDVTIYGGNKIGNVFGGGNGESGIPADVTDGGTYVMIYGGTIGNVYGGSNSSGVITGDISVIISPDAEESSSYCPIDIDNVYGGGNKAPSQAGSIDIYCGYITEYDFHIGSVYGGANQADIDGNIELNIPAGNIDNVFGGNNNSGNINGSIIVEIEESNPSCGMEVGNVYGGGNLAAYSVYGYDDDGTLKTSGDAIYDDPIVNILSGHITGSVFGGGKGDEEDDTHAAGSVVGNPQVTIGDDNDDNKKVTIDGNVYGGGDAANVQGAPIVVVRECETVIGTKIDAAGDSIDGSVYGGGNAADLTGADNGTDVTIWGGHIYRVFGGGNGEREGTEANIAGVTKVKIYGGTINNVFGGSNTRGLTGGPAEVTLESKTEPGRETACDLIVNSVVPGGNKAFGNGGVLNISCGTELQDVYGGANNANIGTAANPVDIILNITGGKINRVFGGNNIGGTIFGKIVVNIDIDEECGDEIGYVYGGGNQANYTAPISDETHYVGKGYTGKYPEVNIIRGHILHDVYGGGLGDETGEKGIVTGNPQVKIYSGTETTIEGTTTDKVIIGGNVFGGGHAGKVEGNTNVVVGFTPPSSTPSEP